MSKSKKILVSFFILFNFLAMIRVHLPQSAPFIKALYTPVDKYLSFFSIYQDWMMFSPNPGRNNSYISAKIKFADGTVSDYEFPGPSRYKFVENYVYGERFRKLAAEGIRRDDHRYMWPDAAKFALRHAMKEQDFLKMPMEVKLYRHWDEVPDLYLHFRPHGAQAVAFQKFNFYTYKVNK